MEKRLINTFKNHIKSPRIIKMHDENSIIMLLIE